MPAGSAPSRPGHRLRHALRAGVVAAGLALLHPPSAPRPDPAAGPEPPPLGPTHWEQAKHRAVRAYLVAMAVSSLVAIAVVLAAIDAQSALVPDLEGHGWTFSLLFGPVNQGLRREGWTVVTAVPAGDRRFSDLLDYHVAMDGLFICGYGLMLAWLVVALGHRWWRRIVLLLVGLLVASDVAEDVLALRVVHHRGGLEMLLLLTLTKWILLGLVALVIGLRLLAPRPSRDRAAPTVATRAAHGLRLAGTAIVHQRFSYAPVVVIFALSVPTGTPILEQLPDAQRAWLFDGSEGRRQAVAAVVCTALLALFLLSIGRERTLYAIRPRPADYGAGRFGVWLVGPLLALAGVLLFHLQGKGSLILAARTWVWVAVPVAVVVSSLVVALCWWLHESWYRPYRPPVFDPEQQSAVGIAGTVAAAAAVVTGGLSLLRALTPLVVVPAQVYAGTATTHGWNRMLGVLLVLGALAVLGPWVLLIVLTRAYGGPCRRPLRCHDDPLAKVLVLLGRGLLRVPGLGRAFRHRDWLLLTAAIAAFLTLGVNPGFAAWLGLSATATLALGSLAGILAGVGLVLQDRPTAEVFRLLRLRRTPLVTLLLLTVVLVGAAGASGTLHKVDAGVSQEEPARQTLDEAFRSWLGRDAQCGLTVDGHPVRPMLMLAAQGGGIRATYWTVTGLQAMDAGTCAAASTLFSGGASGGSVGLTVARFSGTDTDPGADRAVAAVKKMAEPGTLSEAADGTFVRDLVYGATGVPVPDRGQSDPYLWLDRARLIERGWSTSGDWGRRRFLDQQQVSAATGSLILNSTSVNGNCRVWLSQLQLEQEEQPRDATFDPELTCDKTRGPAPRTIDLFAAYGPLNPGDQRRCLNSLSTPTAALLTARFPYLTPSGVVCPRLKVDRSKPTLPYWPRTQLVDGGYIDNSGLATITDLTYAWQPLVRKQNEVALADASGTEPLVVPFVVYLANGARSTAQPAVGRAPVSELAVPPVTFLHAQSALTNDDAQLARAREAVDLDGFCPGGDRQPVCRQVEAGFRSRVVVVDRATQPEIAAPLGWVMSEASLNALQNDMRAQQSTTCPANHPPDVLPHPRPEAAAPVRATCRGGYATLGDLRGYLTRTGP